MTLPLLIFLTESHAITHNVYTNGACCLAFAGYSRGIILWQNLPRYLKVMPSRRKKSRPERSFIE